MLSTFFGFGITLLTFINQRDDANQAGLDKYLFGQAAALVEDGRRSSSPSSAASPWSLVLLFYKEFKLLTFDPEFAGSLGFGTNRLSVLLDLPDRRRRRDRAADRRRGADGGDADRARRRGAAVDQPARA